MHAQDSTEDCALLLYKDDVSETASVMTCADMFDRVGKLADQEDALMDSGLMSR
jgi:hypothetical protein